MHVNWHLIDLDYVRLIYLLSVRSLQIIYIYNPSVIYLDIIKKKLLQTEFQTYWFLTISGGVRN